MGQCSGELHCFHPHYGWSLVPLGTGLPGTWFARYPLFRGQQLLELGIDPWYVLLFLSRVGLLEIDFLLEIPRVFHSLLCMLPVGDCIS